MSLPPGFLDELRTRTSLAQVAGRKVMWDMRKSNQGKGDMWSPCPFHQEKTASFHVDDRKGYYYCFGCHAKGDAISFVRETENVEFMEAVRILAQEAGMQIPERDPQAQAQADRRSQLVAVMEQAVAYFRLQLQTGAGAAARDYLARRGLSGAAQDRFEIGFAPEGWQNLWEHLRGKSIAEDLIMSCGLAKPSQKGGTPYDTFRNRIMFPIRDARGRAIAFGGRAMDPNDNAKYLNSPETELFDKSRTLYNLGPAREAAGKGHKVIVAEGYMDVIALSEAGFAAAVAPLGTAVTEHQLSMLWRISDEPVIALDGDTAGLRAAHRVIDLALPMLEGGKALRFAIMPEGQDPDDLIRASGAAAVQSLLDAAMPMVQLLWDRETTGRDFDSPERRAALDGVLRQKISLIRDASVRRHYGEAIKALRWELFRPRRDPAKRTFISGRFTPPRSAMPQTKSSLLASGEDTDAELREAVIIATLFTTPAVCTEFEDALIGLAFRRPEFARLRDLALQYADDGAETLWRETSAAVGSEMLESLLTRPHVALTPAIRHAGDLEIARQTLSEELAKLTTRRGVLDEVAEAAEDLAGLADEAVTWRLREATEARNRAARSVAEDKTEYETGDNGVAISRQEREAFDALLHKIGFSGSKD